MDANQKELLFDIPSSNVVRFFMSSHNELPHEPETFDNFGKDKVLTLEFEINSVRHDSKLGILRLYKPSVFKNVPS